MNAHKECLSPKEEREERVGSWGHDNFNSICSYVKRKCDVPQNLFVDTYEKRLQINMQQELHIYMQIV